MKKFLKTGSIHLLLILFSVLICACDNEDDDAGNVNEIVTSNIVETAQDTDALSTLVAALEKADENEGSNLIATLNGDGPFTVFAPTNDAFLTLFEQLDGFDTLEDFDTEEEKALLASILQYHVIVGTAAGSSDLSNEQELSTAQGETLTVVLNEMVFIQDATDEDAEVIIPDVIASNGVVHVVDKVLLPQEVIDTLNELGTLVDIVVANESLSLLEAAVLKADLAETLSGEGPFTVFAPTDDAFTDLLTLLGSDYMTLDDFDTEEEIDLLTDILLYHVIPAQVLEADLIEGEVATALPENNIQIISSEDTFVIGDASDVNANITETDILASNGVAHTIDKVLLPQRAIEFVATLTLKNIVEIATQTDDLSLLVEALVRADAGLVEALAGDGPFTVFAPDNHAFVELLEVLGDGYHGIDDFDTPE
ncbi:MAG: fasciclin domain-containing protein, partial [Bacteroidota bacterium]